MYRILFFLVMCLYSCTNKYAIGENIEYIVAYKQPMGVLIPVSTSKEIIKSFEPDTINNKDTLQIIKNSISQLVPTDYKASGSLRLLCYIHGENNGSCELSYDAIHIVFDNSYYEIDSTFLELIYGDNLF